MKTKAIIGAIVAVVLLVVLDNAKTLLIKKNKSDFQEALINYKYSSKANSYSSVHNRVGNLESQKKQEKSVFPTKEEINSVNARLPMMVAEGTLNTKVDYNEETKVQSFYYRFTQEVDKSLITRDLINRLKANMVQELKKDPGSVDRLKAGMTFLYVYYSVENKKLYEIMIDSNDIE